MKENKYTDTGAATIRKIIYFTVLAALFVQTGCSLSGGPRIRIGYLPTDTFGIAFADPNNLGTHTYGWGFPSEQGGIIYTCKGGHLDLDHVRGNADITKYLFKKIHTTLSKKRKSFSFSLTGESSTHKVSLSYPPNWDKLPNKDEIVDKISYDTAAYLSFNSTIWHEILTWFGVKFALVEPEYNSAFSWEDVYSDLVGTQLGIEALKDKNNNFDQAMTKALYRRLRELEVQPRSTAIAASDKVRGKWYTGNLVPDMKMRNFDIGLDGTVTPILVPGVSGCDNKPLPLPVPTLETLRHYGLSMTYEIKPNVIFEQGRIFKAAGSKRIFPREHFPILIEYMKKEAVEKGYQYYE